MSQQQPQRIEENHRHQFISEIVFGLLQSSAFRRVFFLVSRIDRMKGSCEKL